MKLVDSEYLAQVEIYRPTYPPDAHKPEREMREILFDSRWLRSHGKETREVDRQITRHDRIVPFRERIHIRMYARELALVRTLSLSLCVCVSPNIA